MSLFATFEALPFLSESGSFVVGQGSPGTGTSRGKIHGIWVFRKTLLPLLSGGSLIWVSGVEFSLSPKIRLVGEIFAVLSDSAFYPVLQGLVMTGWFKCEHRFLQPLREPLEILPAYHAGQFMVSSQFGQLLELGRVFVQLSSLHLEFEELLLGPFPAHHVLEVLGKVIDHCIPDPFIGVSSPCA